MKPAARNTDLRKLIAILALTAFAAACGEGTEPTDEPDEPATGIDDPTLVDADILLEGAPSNDELPGEGKADQELPASFTDLQSTQSPVQSQGSRGVCSIFATVAYMEHLYIAEGTMLNPDFSEQYLQWSAKFEVGRFPNSGGSNAAANLEAISDYGIPEEAAWPYETTEWNASNDPDCGEPEEGRSKPTKCFTNGAPPEAALAAPKYKLPRSRYISTRARDIKSHIFNTKTAVQVGMTFFYQSWNHRRSQLPRNLDYWAEGYVLYPNAEDKEISLEKRAGHSILLVGWDDDLEVPIRDKDGEVVTDENGEPVVERGFFLFKNSWGTGSFGNRNPHGDGFGWLSYRYVEEYGSGRVAGLPELDVDPEICGDGIDNDGNFAVDCDDAACAAEPVCTQGPEVIDIPVDGASIPDNDPAGVEVPFTIDGSGALQAFNLTVNIEHSFRGDLSIQLVHPDGTSTVVRANDGASGLNLEETFVVDAFVGKESGGTYRMIVTDHAAVDTGSIVSANAEIVR